MPATPTNIRVLLVDDEPNVVRALVRTLAIEGEALELLTCPSVPCALAVLAREPVDVLVTDLHMPGHDGAELLRAAQHDYPRVVRFVLSGHARHEIFLQASTLAHKYFAKPCNAGLLYRSILEAATARHRIQDERLQTAITGIVQLPALAAEQAEWTGILADDEVDLGQLEEHLSRDPAIVAKLLQIANSAFFGTRGTVASVADAIALLGLETIRGIAAVTKLYSTIVPAEAGEMSLLWPHSVRASLLIAPLAKQLHLGRRAEREAVAACLLHDVGKALLLRTYGAAYAGLAHATPVPQLAWAEHKAYGNHHADVGAALLELWGLPTAFVEAVALHHEPHLAPENHAGPLLLVHLADALAYAQSDPLSAEQLLDRPYLLRLGLPTELSLWRAPLLSP